MEAIERIEVSMRANFSDILSVEHSNLHFYSDQNIYTSENNYHKFMDKVVASLKNIDNSNNVKYQQTFSRNGIKHNLPPSWELFHLMTFKQLSVFVASLKNRNTKLISSKFDVRTTQVFVSWLHAISDLRNICAHHSRLWNRLFGTQPMIPHLDINSIAFVPDEIDVKEKSIKIKPHRKLYFQIVVLWFFLKQTSPHSSWVNRLKDLIQEYNIDARYMGFPDNWYDDKFWQID